MVAFLNDEEDGRQVALTISSLVVAAAAGVVASVVDEVEPTESVKLPAWISLAGGLALLATRGLGRAARLVGRLLRPARPFFLGLGSPPEPSISATEPGTRPSQTRCVSAACRLDHDWLRAGCRRRGYKDQLEK